MIFHSLSLSIDWTDQMQVVSPLSLCPPDLARHRMKLKDVTLSDEDFSSQMVFLSQSPSLVGTENSCGFCSNFRSILLSTFRPRDELQGVADESGILLRDEMLIIKEVTTLRLCNFE